MNCSHSTHRGEASARQTHSLKIRLSAKPNGFVLLFSFLHLIVKKPTLETKLKLGAGQEMPLREASIVWGVDREMLA